MVLWENIISKYKKTNSIQDPCNNIENFEKLPVSATPNNRARVRVTSANSDD